MLTNTQLEYLVAVDRHGSFSKAATHCYVTQPTLSMQIQKLEAELGVVLFDRSRKPVQATPVGRAVIEQAYRTLREFRAIGELVRDQRDAVSGELRLGIIPTLGPYLLPRFIQGMLDVHRDIRVTVRELLTADMVEALCRDMLDAGIAATPLAMPGISETPLFYEPFHGFVSTGHRLAAKRNLSVGDFAADEMILLDSGHCLGSQVSQLCAGPTDFIAEGAARLRFVGGSLEGLVRIVESGHGVTLLPELAVRSLRSASRKRVRPLKSPVPTRQISLVTHGDGVKIRLLEVLAEAILNGIPGELKSKQNDWQIIAVKAG